MTKKKLDDLHDEIEKARYHLSEREGAYLRATGWTYSSGHPDHVWRWSKQFDGRNYSLSQTEALELQERVGHE